MQHMRAAGDAQCTAFALLCRSLVGWPDGLDCGTDRHACSKRDDVWPRLPPADREHSFARSFSPMRRSILSMSSSFATGLGRSYSITSSASESRLSEILTPSALAVLRLITVSNLVGCSTGRSAGFAPLRIRALSTPYCR